MKKLFAGVLLSFILLAPSLSHAQTTTVELQAQYQSALRQLIVLLTQRVEMLQKQLVAQQSADASRTEQTSDSESTSRDSKSSADSESAGTLTVTTVPLLAGGNAKAGASVPVSYLQLRNTGTEAVHLSGFWVKQNGSAPESVVAQLTTVDDKGGSRGASGSNPFDDGEAFAPTDATIAPGGIKLFTIKAVMGSNLTAHLFKNLKIDVTGVDTNGGIRASFPLRGTTWTLTN